ncbi:gephyrin-like molybdotransferase Glp [Fortiea contorta]|uniref:molybdopterin molybdotransferase MoeA n=1 Tax=Fortiea contorta TaxID=1892405 RepID=UPI000344F9B7|nr:gephyrin-like molybdotransferase Glp [Fortiea contorta]
MLSVNDTQTIIFNLVQPLASQRDQEVVDLFAATGRILAAPVVSQRDFPHWDNSAMDGYAVRYEDVQHCNVESPTILEIVTEIPAGYQPQCAVQSGQAARIFTGAVMPQGADTVVMQENTHTEGNRVFILTAPKPQAFVRHKGSFSQTGAQLLPAGIVLNAPEIAILAAASCACVSVYRRPRVAIFSTGDELVTPEQPLQPGQIVDSNQYALAALVRQSGGEPLILGIVKDDPIILAATISQALSNADMVISSGGVSVGDYDYIDKILESLGATIHGRAVAMRPGKPLTVASFVNHGDNLSPQPQKLYLGLPGNPVAVLVTFWRFVQPAIKKLAGMSDGWEVKFLQVRSHDELRSDGNRETYICGKLQIIAGVYHFYKAGGTHSSGNLINLAETNALAILPVGTTLISANTEVEVLLISNNEG